MAARPSSRNCGLKPVVRSSPLISASTASVAMRLVAGARVEHDLVVAELHLHGRVALGDERDALDRLDQLGLVDLRDGEVLGGEQRADLGELAVEQPGGGATHAAQAGALEADQALAATARAERDGDLGARGQRLGRVAEHLGRTSAATDSSGDCGFQVSSRCESRKRSVARRAIVEPSISIRTPVSTGSMSSRPAAVTAWATAWAKSALGDGARGRRHLGQRRVVVDRHGLQAEAGGAADERDARTLQGQLDRLGREAPADVRQQAAADQGLALVVDLGVERGPGRDLVVEGGEDEAGVVASISRPARTGELGRTGRLRAAQATASAKTSRSTRNFTRGLLGSELGDDKFSSSCGRSSDSRARAWDVHPATATRRRGKVLPRAGRVRRWWVRGPVLRFVVVIGSWKLWTTRVSAGQRRKPCAYRLWTPAVQLAPGVWTSPGFVSFLPRCPQGLGTNDGPEPHVVHRCGACRTGVPASSPGW